METKSKAKTYVGFAIRSNKFKIGVNAVATLKRASLMIVCSGLTDNGLKDALKLARRFKCPLLKVKEGKLSDYTFKEGGKVLAITDFALSKAILLNAEKDFIEIETGDSK